MNKTSIAIESFFVIPRNQFYWSYKINEGVLHTIHQDRLFNFLKGHVSQKNYLVLTNLISKFKPFIILVKEDKIIELTKKEVDSRHYRKNITAELDTVIKSKQYKQQQSKEKEKILNNIWKKLK